jgi:hypothetical protein
MNYARDALPYLSMDAEGHIQCIHNENLKLWLFFHHLSNNCIALPHDSIQEAQLTLV